MVILLLLKFVRTYLYICIWVKYSTKYTNGVQNQVKRSPRQTCFVGITFAEHKLKMYKRQKCSFGITKLSKMSAFYSISTLTIFRKSHRISFCEILVKIIAERFADRSLLVLEICQNMLLPIPGLNPAINSKQWRIKFFKAQLCLAISFICKCIYAFG